MAIWLLCQVSPLVPFQLGFLASLEIGSRTVPELRPQPSVVPSSTWIIMMFVVFRGRSP